MDQVYEHGRGGRHRAKTPRRTPAGRSEEGVAGSRNGTAEALKGSSMCT